jgi:hypothetical protein
MTAHAGLTLGINSCGLAALAKRKFRHKVCLSDSGAMARAVVGGGTAVAFKAQPRPVLAADAHRGLSAAVILARLVAGDARHPPILQRKVCGRHHRWADVDWMRQRRIKVVA